METNQTATWKSGMIPLKKSKERYVVTEKQSSMKILHGKP